MAVWSNSLPPRNCFLFRWSRLKLWFSLSRDGQNLRKWQLRAFRIMLFFIILKHFFILSDTFFCCGIQFSFIDERAQLSQNFLQQNFLFSKLRFFFFIGSAKIFVFNFVWNFVNWSVKNVFISCVRLKKKYEMSILF